MTGYIQGSLAAGHKEVIGVFTDNVDAGLTAFVRKLVTAVSGSTLHPYK